MDELVLGPEDTNVSSKKEGLSENSSDNPKDIFDTRRIRDTEDNRDIEVALRKVISHRAEESLDVSESTKSRYLRLYKQQVDQAEKENRIPFVDEVNTVLEGDAFSSEDTTSGDVTAGEKPPLLIHLGKDPAGIASVWERIPGVDLDEAFRVMKHEIGHAIIIEQAGIIPEYVFVLSKTRDGKKVANPAVHYTFPPEMPLVEQARWSLKSLEIVEDPSQGDLAQIAKYKKILLESK